MPSDIQNFLLDVSGFCLEETATISDQTFFLQNLCTAQQNKF